jgi:beta-galactosidase/beta-glucuronidase
VRDAWLNLNGTWEFEFDPGQSGEARGLAADGGYSREIVVPFCPESELSGIGEVDFHPCVWYRREFTVPEAWAGQRVILHVGAADYEATVWVNGQRAGTHRGGYTPFRFDVTDLLQPGDNRLVVRAVDDTRSRLQPSGKQSHEYHSHACMYTRTTGIWQTVWLEPVPAARIESARLRGSLAAGSIAVEATLLGDLRGLTLVAEVSLDGRPVGEASTPATGDAPLLIALSEVQPWGPGHPVLYDLTLTLRDEGGQVRDRVVSYCGLRDLEIVGDRLLLNGQTLFMRLVLDQGFYPDGIYTAPSDAELRADVERGLAMGFDGARLHQKVFEPRFLYWADRLGYLVWGEYPDWGLDWSRPEALRAMLPEWLEAVERDRNHPSLIGWCPFNETSRERDPELLRTVYRATKAADPTRPALDTSGYVHVETTDLYDCHNYTQDPAEFAAFFAELAAGGEPYYNCPGDDALYRGQPYFVSEYGGIWWNPDHAEDSAWGYGERPRSAEEFLARYQGLAEALLSHPHMCGLCYTQLYDVEQEVNGLYTYDRQPKFAPEIIAEINRQKAAVEQEAK